MIQSREAWTSHTYKDLVWDRRCGRLFSFFFSWVHRNSSFIIIIFSSFFIFIFFSFFLFIFIFFFVCALFCHVSQALWLLLSRLKRFMSLGVLVFIKMASHTASVRFFLFLSVLTLSNDFWYFYVLCLCWRKSKVQFLRTVRPVHHVFDLRRHSFYA